MNVEVWGFHFPPAQKTPVNSSNNSQSRRAFVAVSVTDVRLSGRLFWCVWNFYGCFHVHVFCFHLPDETSSERAPAFGVKRPLGAWPARGVARSEDSGRWGA